MKPGPTRLAAVAAVLLSACATAQRPLYYWGDYEESLYARYNEHDPAEAQAQLQEVIETAEGGEGKVPPGVYADYGFLLYQRGDPGSAVLYFQKEAAAFPEAEPLMSKLIARVQGGGSKSAEPRRAAPEPGVEGGL